MLNLEVIFLKIVTGTSDLGGNPIFWKLSVAEGNTTIFFWPKVNLIKIPDDNYSNGVDSNW